MLCSLIVKGMVGLYPAVPFHRLDDSYCVHYC